MSVILSSIDKGFMTLLEKPTFWFRVGSFRELSDSGISEEEVYILYFSETKNGCNIAFAANKIKDFAGQQKC